MKFEYVSYTVIDRDKYDTSLWLRDSMFSTTEYESLDSAIRERNRLALSYGKEFCLGVGAFGIDGVLHDITDEIRDSDLPVSHR